MPWQTPTAVVVVNHGLEPLMRTFARRVTLTLALSLLAASGAAAQSVSADSTPSAAADSTLAVPQAGPTVASAAVAVRATSPEISTRTGVAEALQQEQRLGHGRNVALMIVGGAAVVAGLLIGDDAGALLAVGGAVVGLYGLFQYVR